MAPFGGGTGKSGQYRTSFKRIQRTIEPIDGIGLRWVGCDLHLINMAASCAPQRPVFESRSRRVIRSTIVGPTNTAGERDKTEGDMEATDISAIPELAK